MIKETRELEQKIKEQEKITLTVIIKKVGTKKEEYKEIVFPMTKEEFEKKGDELSTIKTAKYIVSEFKSNLSINLIKESENYYFLLEKIYGDNFIDRVKQFQNQYSIYIFEKLNAIITILNKLSTFDEMQTLIEIVTDNLEELLQIVFESKYHFYPHSFKQDSYISDSIIYYKPNEWYKLNFCQYFDYIYDDDDELEVVEDDLTDKGYFLSSRGTILIQDKFLYHKAKLKYDSKKNENISKS